MTLPLSPIYMRSHWTLMGCLLGSLSCASRMPPQEPMIRPRIVRIPIQARDTAGISQMAGKLVVRVRDAGGSKALPQTQVLVLSKKDESLPRSAIRWTDSLGIVRVDWLPAGKPFVRLHALGYHPLLTPAEIIAGCTSLIEAFMSPFSCDIGPCKETPPRVTLTLCRKPDA